MQKSHNRLLDLAESGLTLVATLIAATLVGVGVAVFIVVGWFNNTRADGIAIFLIVSIATGLFANLVGFTAMISRHHIPSTYVVPIPALPWISLATFLTWNTCKSSYITWDNWMWVLRSSDQRIYELNWIIRGWLGIGLAGFLGLMVSRKILKRVTAKQHTARLAAEG